MPECPVEKGCLVWVELYLRDCVCSPRDTVSLVLGLLSVVSWGVAEVPQIITNFREKSTEGVSLLFLMTWVIGDLFNLAGCYLEPATLPTQFYMAVLYTLTTLVLVGQTIYYDHLMRRIQRDFPPKTQESNAFPEVIHVKAMDEDNETMKIPSQTTSINVPHLGYSPGRDLYYMSARSLASSHVPTAGSYGVGSRGGSGSGYVSSYLLPHEDYTTISTDPIPIGSHPITAARSASYASNLLRTVSDCASAFDNFPSIHSVVDRSYQPRFPFGLLGDNISPTGEVFGWIMAAIYMGGRLPQIWLNIKRGTVEGLNPLMFMFALIGNITYVGSIVVRSMEWTHLKPNLPWLVDAAVCVLLDVFIIFQFVYFYRKTSKLDEDDDNMAASYHPLP
ncbi:unnamed protein product [Sphagnum jensenii]|uniref:Vacuolar amino acid transporter YPQ1 n=1 Tax=Sphagnum jensenii TaxID=128206 RepID=A0ABP0WUB0_9BRYO